MMSKSHKVTARRAFSLLTLPDISGRIYLSSGKDREKTIKSCGEVDYFRDLEFIDVWGEPDDDPHSDEALIEDEPHRSSVGMDFTAFNHFIDIKKGPGQFDDYDGYSYEHGSGSRGEHQNATDLIASHASSVSPTGTFLDDALIGGIHAAVWASDMKVDQAIMWWFNDEYVHAPGQTGYRDGKCSPALERYSFFNDKGIYPSLDDEMSHRFPKGDESPKGIPYSVFMPLDNMARYWYEKYCSNSGYPECLGVVLHAIQDATIPHHAAGCLGNWHAEYEKDLDDRIKQWLPDSGFENKVVFSDAKRLVKQWMVNEENAPERLSPRNRDSKPGINWRADQLVTWMALQAYQTYENIYKSYRDGYTINEDSLKTLTSHALALSTLVLLKASKEKPQHYVGDCTSKILHMKYCERIKSLADDRKEWYTTIDEATTKGYKCCPVCLLEGIEELLDGGYIGNLNTGELHDPRCHWVEQMTNAHKEIIGSAKEALSRGYNGCYYCLRTYDTG